MSCYNSSSYKWCCQLKRLGLLIVLLSSASFYFEEIRTMIYVPIIIFINMFFIFLNFPEILLFLNSKPVYVDDIFIDPTTIQEEHKLHPRIVDKFRNIYLLSHNLVSSAFAAGLSDFFLYQIQDRLSFYEVLGVIGGILNIYNILITYFGKFLIYILIDRKMKLIRNMPIPPSKVNSNLRLTQII